MKRSITLTTFFLLALKLIFLANPTFSLQTSNIVQVISLDGHFQEKQFSRYLSDFLTETARPIKIVTVIGIQSSGKSTLLNHLFATDFTTDRPRENDRSTEGVWASFIPDTNILVLDTEGSNSHERFSINDRKYENKIIHYSALVSNIYLINLNSELIYHEDEYSNAEEIQHSGIKNIFKNLILSYVHFELDRALGHKEFLFVLRDFDEVVHNRDHLQQVIKQRLVAVWEKVFSETLYNAELADKMDVFVSQLKFVYVPHFKKRREGFDEEVARLRDYFYGNEMYTTAVASQTELAKDLKTKWEIVSNHTYCLMSNSSQGLMKDESDL